VRVENVLEGPEIVLPGDLRAVEHLPGERDKLVPIEHRLAAGGVEADDVMVQLFADRKGVVGRGEFAGPLQLLIAPQIIVVTFVVKPGDAKTDRGRSIPQSSIAGILPGLQADTYVGQALAAGQVGRGLG